MDTKFKFYQQHGIKEYYLYNPKKNRLQGWLRNGKKLNEISQMEGWISPLLEIRFTTREVVEQRDLQKQRADLEQQRANLAEGDRDRALERADRERLEKELEKQRADRAESDLQKMRERLLQLGIDPKTLP